MTNIFLLQNQFNTSVCSNISFTARENKTEDEHATHRSSSVRFKDNDIDRESATKIHPIWRPGYESDTEAPQYRSIKPILTPTTGRSSAISVGRSPIPPCEFEKPQRFTSTNEQLNTISRDYQVLKPKPVSARPFNQSKPFSSHSEEKSTQFYTATAGPPYHNQKNVASESSSHMEIREATESSQRIVNVSSMRKVITYDQQEQEQQHHSRGSFEKSLEPFPFTVSPTPSISRQRLRPPPTPTKFIPGEFRESDYDSEIESMKIRPLWTPNLIESERLHNYHHRHVSPPTSRCASVPKHHFERILTPMDFDVDTVEMPTKIKCLPTSPTYSSQQQTQYKTQTLDRFRSKKKSSTPFGASSSQDDINIMHSTPKYSRIRSPYVEESRTSQYGKLIDSRFSKLNRSLCHWICMGFHFITSFSI